MIKHELPKTSVHGNLAPKMSRLCKQLFCGSICTMLLLTGYLSLQAERRWFSPDQLRGLSDEELMRLQYYSNGFALVRPVSNTTEVHASATLLTKNGQAYEIIRIKRGLPGIATAISQDRRRISVSFEPGCSIAFNFFGGAFTLVHDSFAYTGVHCYGS